MSLNREGTGKTNLDIEQFKLDDLNNLPTQIKVRDRNGYSRWLTCTDVSGPDLPTLEITRNGVYAFMGGRVEADVGAWDIEPLTITENNIEITPDIGVKYSPITVALPMEEKTVTSNGTYTPSGDNQGFSEVTVDLPLEEATYTSNGTYTPSEGYEGISKVTVALPLEQPTYTKNGVYRPSTGYEGMSRVNVQIPYASGLVEKLTDLYRITTSHTVVYGPTNKYTLLASDEPSNASLAPNPPVRIYYDTCGCSFKFMFTKFNYIGANGDSVVIPWGYRTYFKQMTLSAYESAWTSRTDAYNAADIDMSGISQADFLTLCQTYKGDFSFSSLSSSILDNWTDESLLPIDPGIGILRIDIPSLSTYRLFSGDTNLRTVILKIGYASSTAGGLLHRLPNLEAVWLEGNPPSGTYPGSWFNGYDGYIWVESGKEQVWRTWFSNPTPPDFIDRINQGDFSWYTIDV